MGFLEVLCLIFVVLKLMGQLDWSWFWVLSPMIPAVFVYLIVLAFLVLGTVGASRVYGRRVK